MILHRNIRLVQLAPTLKNQAIRMKTRSNCCWVTHFNTTLPAEVNSLQALKLPVDDTGLRHQSQQENQRESNFTGDRERKRQRMWKSVGAFLPDSRTDCFLRVSHLSLIRWGPMEQWQGSTPHQHCLEASIPSSPDSNTFNGLLSFNGCLQSLSCFVLFFNLE